MKKKKRKYIVWDAKTKKYVTRKWTKLEHYFAKKKGDINYEIKS